MATRPLDRLTSIRAKLGSTVVIAVALALAISYVLIAFALRNSPRDSEAIDALSLARKAATGRLGSVPPGTMVVIRYVQFGKGLFQRFDVVDTTTGTREELTSTTP